LFLGQIVGYLFQPAETKTHNGKTFHIMKVKVANNKHGYIFVDCFLNEGILKYASLIEKDSQVLVCGDIIIGAYTSKTGEPSPKITCQVKVVKAVGKPQEKDKQNPEYFLF